jgi:glycerol-3-phosphate acyltransferase PlsY
VFEGLAALAVGYLVGSVPTAAWIARAKGKDVFGLGSGNMGAMNTARNLGFGLGAAVLVVDVAKGALATFLGMLIAGASSAAGGTDPSLLAPLAAGFGAVLGHAFSMFVGFSGGKGLATTFGVSLPLYPQVGLAALVLIVALILITRSAGVAAVITVLTYPFLALLTLNRFGWEQERAFEVVTGVLPIVLVVLLKHALQWRGGGKVTASEGDPRRRPR